MNLAPIALFVYNRPWHLQKTVEALQKNESARESELFIFSDGPKNDVVKEDMGKVRRYIRTISGFKKVTIIEKERNFGLARSIITGVTDIIKRYGKVITLEDDLVTSPFFLKFMNEGLDLYEKEEKVISIHGYIYPVKSELPETFFIRGADCWGWATWKRGWNLFEEDGSKLLREITGQGLERAFNFNNSYDYVRILKNQIAGKNDSWAIRWHASAILLNKLTLYPGKSMVNNIGHDDSGIHCSLNNYFNTLPAEQAIRVGRIEVAENHEALEAIKRYMILYRREKIKNRIRKIWNIIRK